MFRSRLLYGQYYRCSLRALLQICQTGQPTRELNSETTFWRFPLLLLINLMSEYRIRVLNSPCLNITGVAMHAFGTLITP